MTKVQENLMVKWLENEMDDEDAQMLIKDFDPDNLRSNLRFVNSLSVTKKQIEDSWDDFLNRKNIK